MDVKEAVNAAKTSISELFGDQVYSEPALEEFEFNDSTETWRITIGFLRMPEISPGDSGQTEGALSRHYGLGFGVPRRAYKVVTIDGSNRRVLSVKDRELA